MFSRSVRLTDFCTAPNSNCSNFHKFELTFPWFLQMIAVLNTGYCCNGLPEMTISCDKNFYDFMWFLRHKQKSVDQAALWSRRSGLRGRVNALKGSQLCKVWLSEIAYLAKFKDVIVVKMTITSSKSALDFWGPKNERGSGAHPSWKFLKAFLCVIDIFTAITPTS